MGLSFPLLHFYKREPKPNPKLLSNAPHRKAGISEGHGLIHLRRLKSPMSPASDEIRNQASSPAQNPPDASFPSCSPLSSLGVIAVPTSPCGGNFPASLLPLNGFVQPAHVCAWLLSRPMIWELHPVAVCVVLWSLVLPFCVLLGEYAIIYFHVFGSWVFGLFHIWSCWEHAFGWVYAGVRGSA